MADFKTPERFKEMANSFPEGYSMLLNYMLSDLEKLREAKHLHAEMLTKLDAAFLLQKEELHGIAGKLDKLVEIHTNMLENQNKAKGIIATLKFLGFGSVVAGFVGIVAYIVHKIGGN